MTKTTALVFSVLALAGCNGLVLTSDEEGSASQGLLDDLHKVFRKGRFDVARIDASTLRRVVTDDHQLSVSTSAGTKLLVFEPNELRGDRYRAEMTTPEGTTAVPRGPLTTYRGSVAGEPGSPVRFALGDGGIKGFFTVKGAAGPELVFMQPASDFAPKSAAVGDLLLYREDSFLVNAPTPIDSMPALLREGTKVSAGTSMLQTRQLEVATDADFPYVAQFPGQTPAARVAAANQRTLEVMNMIEGVYAQQVSLNIDVVYQHAWVGVDPYYTSTIHGDIGPLLDTFRATWSQEPAPGNPDFRGVGRDVAVLFTERPSALGFGVAYGSLSVNGVEAPGVICRASGRFSYSLVGHFDTTSKILVAAAHELGHNLGAGHRDGDAGNQNGCLKTIMNPFVSNETALSFCAGSQGDITSYVQLNGNCLAAQACTPATCAQVGANCGAVPDGCGGTLDCGSCGGGQTCGGGGMANVCGGGCMPTTCAQQGASCGSIPDGCGGSLQCGTCSGGQTCGGGGTANVCGGGCTPTTCQAQGAGCGLIPDGCGAMLACGDCPGGQSCGGGGTANQCGVAAPAAFDVEYWGQSGDVPHAGNFYGGARADLAIFRGGDPLWYVRERGDFNSSNPQYFGWGFASDQTVILHFPGGPDLISQWRDSDGTWYTWQVGVGPVSYKQFGQSGDMPVAGNLRAFGTDLAVYRPSNGYLYTVDYAGTAFSFRFVGSIPAERLFAGDFLGRGYDQVAFYASGQWTIVDNVTGEQQTVSWGQAGDQPFVGRLLSAGVTTLGVFRGETVYLREASGGTSIFQFGQPGDVPLAGDYRARGKDDLVQWRPSTGEWFIFNGL